MINRLLGFYLSMQHFIKSYAHILTSPLKIGESFGLLILLYSAFIACIDIDNELRELQQELENAESPWQKFKEHVKTYCWQLKHVFCQLIQLFNSCRPLSSTLLEEFDQKRIKRLAEGFLFVEDTVHSLLEPKLISYGRVFESIKKSACFNTLPRIPIRVEGTDIESTNM